ncbi:MAG: alpha/beta hydrolase [Microcoleaceae cyanobacterium]
MGWLKSWTLTLTTILFTVTPVQAAEQITFPLGNVEVSISVDELETFAESGHLDRSGKLITYLQWFKPDQRKQIQALLSSEYSFNSTALEGLLKSPMVASFLLHIGQIIETEGRENGAEALRTAIVQAASQQQNFTLIDALRQFPSPSLRINLQQTADLLSEIATLIQQTDAAVAKVEQLARQEAQQQLRSNLNLKKDLRETGSFVVRQETLSLDNIHRRRQFETDLYLPIATDSDRQNIQPRSISVIVISHGLASDRSRFNALAEHLTSYGFAVAVPQHPGSDIQQLQNLLKGDSDQLFEEQQLIDRPLDISYLLDYLEDWNKTEFSGQLNLDKVGVWGHSLGGYTGLALAGATLNFEQLQTDCVEDSSPINPSLFLQCRALELPGRTYQLQDPRVQAVFLLNPINSSIFGKTGLSQIQVPVMMTASSNDLLAPALLEQIQSFTWLKTPERYLALKTRDHHFYDVSGFEEAEQKLTPLGRLVSPSSRVTHSYVNALSVAFFQTYINQDNDYRPYLQAAYGNEITVVPYTFSILTSRSQPQLINALEKIFSRSKLSISLPEQILSNN